VVYETSWPRESKHKASCVPLAYVSRGEIGTNEPRDKGTTGARKEEGDRGSVTTHL